MRIRVSDKLADERGAQRWVLHVDLDQFIAAVEVLRRPELAGKPVVVGGRGDPTERGVVSTASYEAREFGVGSGMPLRLAARKCPDAVFLPVDAPAYDAASAEVMGTLRSLTWAGAPVVVEVLGWDEAFVAAGAAQQRVRGRGVGPPGKQSPPSPRPTRWRSPSTSAPRCWRRRGCTARSASATTSCRPRSPPTTASPIRGST